MTRAAWLRLALLPAFLVHSTCARTTAAPLTAPDQEAGGAGAGDTVARWSLVAVSASNDGNAQKIAWTSANDGSEQLHHVCAFDVLRVQADWQLSQNQVDALLRQSVRAIRRQKRADEGENADWDVHLQSALHLVAVEVDGVAPDAVVTQAELRERPLSSMFADEEALRKRLEQLVDGDTDPMNRELACEFDEAFCTPRLTGIRLPDILTHDQLLEANHTVVLEFAQPTNRPIVVTKRAIDRYIRFTEYLGDEMTGQWSADGRILEIRVLTVDAEQLKPTKELMQGLLQTTLRLDDSPESDRVDAEVLGDTAAELTVAIATAVMADNAHFRIEPAGLYRVRLAVTAKELGGREIFDAESPDFRVVACEEDSVAVLLRSSLPAIASKQQHSDNKLLKTDPFAVQPSFSQDGVITLAGQEGFVLPHSAIRMQEFGSWSLSFWMLSTQEPAGAFRSLFFNGDGTGDMRTPSAWWKPGERRFVLRVSTNVSLDVGMDSEQLIPRSQWVHLGFNFRNCSRTASGSGGERENSSSSGDTTLSEISDSPQCVDSRRSERPWHYAISFFVDGVKDKDVFFYAPALANNGPLHVGKGPWTDGMRGFMSNLRVYPAAIPEQQHRDVYLQERALHVNFSPEFFGSGEEESGEGGDDDGKDDETRGDLTKVHTTVPDVQSLDWSRPALQIAYLLQRGSIVPRLEATHSASEVAAADSNVKSLQDQTYLRAKQVLDSCDRSGWDILLEAAELGHSEALRDVGKAHLYGLYEFPDSCAVVAKYLALLVQSDVLPRPLEDGEIADWRHRSHGMPLANLTIGLYHLAAMAGRRDAFVVLARRYAVGDGVDAARAIAVFHYFHAAVDASAAHHERGKQPLHEMNRLYDALRTDLTKGQLGDDDELIQFQKLRAEQGDVEAMAAMGDLYYWGARGMPRDHAQAHSYFQRAASAGHVSSQSALAGMLLKGEGVLQNNESAIHWYEKAAASNNTRALNGLGFIHFHGSGGVAENKSLALEFFERAAGNEEDGDSVFNAGYCHAFGLGTAVNFTRAIHFYDIAARKFGHFDAIFELGKIWMVGVDGVVERNMELALAHLKAASDAGRWGKCVRKAFDRYLANDFQRAAALYHEAREYGYPVATSNLAFLYDQRLLRPNDVASEARAFHFLTLASLQNGDKEVLVRIGDYHFYGLAGLQPNAQEAIRWYSRASAEGVDAGAYSVGHMHEYGIGVPVNLDRAERYYGRVLELASGASEVVIVVRIALARLALRKWIQRTPFADFAAAPGLSSHTANSTSRNARLQFSELGGIGLETIWGSGWISVVSVCPFLLAIGLALCGFLYVRRSA